MKTRAFWMLGLAVIFAIAAVFLAQDWLKKRSAAAAKNSMPTSSVVVANTSLKFGAVIRREHVSVIQWPAKVVPKGSFRKVDDLVKAGTSRVVLRRIEANEPILKTKVSGFGGRASLSTVIGAGMRASTIRVTAVSGVAGFVLPGDRVDVMLTRENLSNVKNGRRAKRNLVTDVMLQNIKVLAIDQNASDEKDKPSVAKAVTLEVTPHQSQKLILAQRVGTLSLTLRNVENAGNEMVRRVGLSDLRIGEANDTRSEVPVAKSVAPQTTKTQGKAVAGARTQSRKATATKTQSKTVARTSTYTNTTVVNTLSAVKVTRALKSTNYQVKTEDQGEEEDGSDSFAPAREASPADQQAEDPGPMFRRRTVIQPGASNTPRPIRLYLPAPTGGPVQGGAHRVGPVALITAR